MTFEMRTSVWLERRLSHSAPALRGFLLCPKRPKHVPALELLHPLSPSGSQRATRPVVAPSGVVSMSLHIRQAVAGHVTCNSAPRPQNFLPPSCGVCLCSISLLHSTHMLKCLSQSNVNTPGPRRALTKYLPNALSGGVDSAAPLTSQNPRSCLCHMGSPVPTLQVIHNHSWFAHCFTNNIHFLLLLY